LRDSSKSSDDEEDGSTLPHHRTTSSAGSEDYGVELSESGARGTHRLNASPGLGGAGNGDNPVLRDVNGSRRTNFSYVVEQGRPMMHKILKQARPAFGPMNTTGLFLCGPRALTESVEQELRSRHESSRLEDPHSGFTVYREMFEV
jgi:hypothetical protein